MLGVLGGFLYICNNYAGLDFSIWVMKIYGVEESWTKEIVIARNSPKPEFRTIRPMMMDGNILILSDDETLELYDPRRKKFGNIVIKGVSSILEAVNYVASFDSLRDIVKGECVRDLYVKSK